MADGVWKIRGEGNSSLVVSDNEKHLVYRISKKKNEEKRDPKLSRQRLENNMDFICNIMAPLLSHHFVRPGKLVEVNPSFLKHIETAVQGARAAERLDQNVDLDCPVTLTLPDLCYVLDPVVISDLPTFSIEIKPKRGFLHPSVEEQTWPQAAVCRFCMHQQLKRKQGKWNSLSKYCPLDLFSGVSERMQHAFKCLLRTPQNNLRISRDGDLVWGEGVSLNIADDMKHYFPTCNKLSSPRHKKGLDERMTEISAMAGFFEILEFCLLATSEPHSGLRPGVGNHSQVCAGMSYRGKCKQSGKSGLPVGSVLDKVLQVQKRIAIRVEQFAVYADRLQRHLQANPKDNVSLFGLNGPYDNLDWLDQTGAGVEEDGSVQYAVKKMKEFVVAATAFDCSIMVAIQPIPRPSPSEVLECSATGEKQRCHLVEGRSGQWYQYSVSVVDLDPKAWRKIPGYCDKELEIKSFYSKVAKDS